METVVNGPSANLRSRNKHDNLSAKRSSEAEENETLKTGFKKRRSTVPLLGFRHWFMIIAFIFIIYVTVLYLDSRVPEPVPAGQFEQFSENRARSFLEELTSFGPRPSGSHALEVLATNLIVEELENIKTNVLPVHRMDLDVRF